MAEELEVKQLDDVVVRFSGDSGDGMQLAGNIFSTVSATIGNGISTFPDYPADIRAPQGSLTGVSGFQVHIASGRAYTPGDKCDVLVAMNAAALKTQYKFAKPQATIIIDTDSFGPADLKKAEFKTDDYLGEMGIDPDRVVACPITQMVKDCLADSGLDNKTVLKCRNMFALGVVCWLFNRNLDFVTSFLREKFAKKPAVAECNIITRTFISTNRSLYFLFARLRASESFEWVVFSSLMVFPPTMCCCRSKKSITQNGT